MISTSFTACSGSNTAIWWSRGGDNLILNLFLLDQEPRCMWVQLHSIDIPSFAGVGLLFIHPIKVLTHCEHFYYTSRVSNMYVNAYYTWRRILITVKCMAKIRHHDFLINVKSVWFQQNMGMAQKLCSTPSSTPGY